MIKNRYSLRDTDVREDWAQVPMSALTRDYQTSAFGPIGAGIRPQPTMQYRGGMHANSISDYLPGHHQYPTQFKMLQPDVSLLNGHEHEFGGVQNTPYPYNPARRSPFDMCFMPHNPANYDYR